VAIELARSCGCVSIVMTKLTLNIDEKVMGDAKRYAADRGTSVSQLVERYLALLSKPADASDQPPVLKLLRGAARGGSVEAHHQYLSGEDE
jgi:hypothetical protein